MSSAPSAHISAHMHITQITMASAFPTLPHPFCLSHCRPHLVLHADPELVHLCKVEEHKVHRVVDGAVLVPLVREGSKRRGVGFRMCEKGAF